MLVDSFNRKINYLRLSVTDRCNLRCVYCLPEKVKSFTSLESQMSDEEMILLVSCFAELGVSSVRITGGEPLLRSGIVNLVRHISRIQGIADLSMSTNGVLLSELAIQLVGAGLKRINISLDTLESEKYHQITRFGKLDDVMAGIESALSAGLTPVKINVVVARGWNENEIGNFVQLTRTGPTHVRFIELMPMGETGFFSKERFFSMEEMMEHVGDIEPLPTFEWIKGQGPARYYRVPGAKGTLGFISALSCSFCGSCNRVRLSSKGVLYPCLDNLEGTDLLGLVRLGKSREDILEVIRQTVYRKPEQHRMQERAKSMQESPRVMCQIGG